MKGKWIAGILALCLLLSGCSGIGGSYVYISPHREQTGTAQSEAIPADNYGQLLDVLEDMVKNGTESGIINVTNYDYDVVDKNMTTASGYIRERYPIGAYAVEDFAYEIGTNSGRPAIAVSIQYRHSAIELKKIRKVADMEEAALAIAETLERFDTVLVLEVMDYQDMDVIQLVQDYAEAHPDTVMEIPQVTSTVYGSQDNRVMELTFTYQNGRDALRQMQSQVKLVFDSAALYVSGEGSHQQKYEQLYGFLMERFDYKLETSLTPAYSLLRHGVGDSRAFAQVYAAMCRQAGLECLIVTGTGNGEPRTWNMVKNGEHYFHLDLLRCNEIGGYREFSDADMGGYVWDYSAYPDTVAGNLQEPAEPVMASETPTEK